LGRYQVCELPPISVIVIEHRTHQSRCGHCRARTSEATFLQIAEHCNREQFDALIGTRYPGDRGL